MFLPNLNACCTKRVGMQKLEILNPSRAGGEGNLGLSDESGAAKVIPGRPRGCTHTIQLRAETNQK